MVGEHIFDDVDDALVLPHPALQGVAQQRDPGLDDERLAGQAAVGIQAVGLGDVAAAAGAAAVGQRGVQGDGARVELLEFDVGVEHKRVQLEPERLGDGFVQREALDHQVGRQRAFAGCAGEGVEPGIRLPACDQLPQQVLQPGLCGRTNGGRGGLACRRDSVWQE